MSRTTDWIIRDTDSRTDDDARESRYLTAEVDRLEAEVARLRGVMGAAFALLDEGDPAGYLGGLVDRLRDGGTIDGRERYGLNLVAGTIEDARRFLETGKGEGS